MEKLVRRFGLHLLAVVLTVTFAAGPPVALARQEPAGVQEQIEALRGEIEAQRLRTEALEAELERVRASAQRQAERTAETEVAIAPLAERIEAGDLAGWDRGFYLRVRDDAFRLNIGGWIQPRFEFQRRSDAENKSSFYMRRVRLDLRGHVFTDRLTFRIMPELARTANLRDGWINYAFRPWAQVRFGQFTARSSGTAPSVRVASTSPNAGSRRRPSAGRPAATPA